ncbi:hypothetical protein N0V93_005558 [Gnomoniopsis smithogilvyi]|uniref:Uncharacterized protein n=1 Tax=Gnomoniopsis smithogilvyi TaxID=1191159 RepID=A0A9W9CX91_9PEZI|nr:hypothetical protein N0V93_005558 [Gnomoniopsis smithogilvyi]
MDLDNMIRMREELRISEPHQQVNKADKAWWWQNFSAAGETEAGSAAEETEAEDRDRIASGVTKASKFGME